MGDEKKKKPSNQHRITPKPVVDRVRDFMGGEIALDPCWNPYALTDPIFACDGETSDGLTSSWHEAVLEAGVGGVFINPVWNDPFPWAAKMVAEAEQWHCADDICLWLPFYPETKTGELIWENAMRICCWGNRVNHPEPPIDDIGRLIKDGALKESSGSMWPTWLSYMGPRPKEFEEAFQSAGPVLWGWNVRAERRTPVVLLDAAQ